MKNRCLYYCDIILFNFSAKNIFYYRQDGKSSVEMYNFCFCQMNIIPASLLY